MQRTWTRFLTQQRVRALAAATAGALLAAAAPAHADAPSASHSFFSNLARAGSALSVNEQTAKIEPTLVRGMYAMYDGGGRFVGYINEPGTLFGDFRGLSVISGTAVKARPMTPDEVLDLRAEVMNGIDYDKLIKVSYGDGGGRRQLVFSAVDCGYCKKFEQAMASNGDKLNTTFYVVPSSLRPYNNGGAAAWQTVSSIWCADDKTAAWKAYWSTLKAPAQRQCALDPQAAARAQHQLEEILGVTGVNITATPTFVREDGSMLHNKANMDLAYMNQTFGREAAPPVKVKAQQWLVAGAPQAGGAEVAPAPVPGQPQQPKKIHLNDAIKGLFSK